MSDGEQELQLIRNYTNKAFRTLCGELLVEALNAREGVMKP
jgi:hypothetical protein